MRVDIIINKSRYDKSHKNGADYTSVSYSGKVYGGASPCDTKEQVRQTIKQAKKTISIQGDTYQVVDKTISLLNY